MTSCHAVRLNGHELHTLLMLGAGALHLVTGVVNVLARTERGAGANP